MRDKIVYIYPKYPNFYPNERRLMTWRIHLSNQAIHHLDILPGTPALLAVWTRRDRVGYYDLATGALHEERILEPPENSDRTGEAWRAFLAGLTAPNGVYLPLVHMSGVTIFSGDAGQRHLYRAGDSGLFYAEAGVETALEVVEGTAFEGVAFDATTGVSAALDEVGKLHLYDKDDRVGQFDIGLQPPLELLPSIAIADGGTAFVSDGLGIVKVDAKGQAQKRLAVPYHIGKLACSPDGRHVATSDLDTGVVRIYSGEALLPTHQRFGIDLLASATQVQLLADLPPDKAALSALAVHNAGELAFSLSGVVCVADVSQMDEVPRPQALS